jgi:hypothetical protein
MRSLRVIGNLRWLTFLFKCSRLNSGFTMGQITYANLQTAPKRATTHDTPIFKRISYLRSSAVLIVLQMSVTRLVATAHLTLVLFFEDPDAAILFLFIKIYSRKISQEKKKENPQPRRRLELKLDLAHD